MTEERKPMFIQILVHFVAANNAIMEGNFKEFNEQYKIGSDLFKEHFSDRPESEIDEIARCSRTLYSRYTNTSYMGTFTGRREMWKHLLNQE